MKAIVGLISFLSIISFAHAAGDILFEDFENSLQREGVLLTYSAERVKPLQSYIDRLTQTYSDDPSKNGLTLKLLGKTAESLKVTDQDLLKSNYQKAIHVIHSIVSVPYEGRTVDAGEVLDMLSKFKTSVSNQAANLNNRVSVDVEAKNLTTKDGKYLSAAELSQMTLRQISEQMIPSGHPLWNNFETTLASPTTFDSIEKWSEGQIKKSNKKCSPEYNLSNARKVLFFKEMKTTSTSPKFDVKDSCGVKWKVKLGNEAQIETVAGKLYLAAGGKFQDLVYTVGSVGDKRTVVVLSDPSSVDTTSCKEVATLDQLKNCFITGPYQFNIAPYVSSTGILSDTNGPSLLGQIYNTSLVGRNYVVFKEASLELQAKDAADRSGSTSMNFSDNFDDRVYRGLLVFNMWIGNSDSKDENNKLFLLKSYSNGLDEIIESQHDLGASFGKRSFPGDLNTFTTDDDFLRVSSYDVKFKVPVTYRPLAWDRATFADARWMARNIAAIPTQKIIEMTRTNTWPQFVQDTLAYKLLNRRLQIAKAFKVEEYLDQKSVLAPTIGINLSTPEDRMKAAETLKLPLSLIESEMQRNNLLKANGVSRYVDTVVTNGVIVPCNKSLLIGLLEESQYPSGLSRRQKRRDDNLALPTCRLGM